MTEKTMFGRHWQIVEWLSESSEGMTVKELTVRSGLSDRTVRRCLARFRQQGIPVEERIGDSGVKRFCIAMDADQSELQFTFNEIVALYISRRFMEPMMGTEFWRAMHSALSKLRKRIGVTAIRHFERSVSIIEPTTFGHSDYRRKADIIEELTVAMESRRQVTMRYIAADEIRVTKRTLDPYLFIYNDGSLYFVGYSHKSHRISTWKVDRVRSLIVTNKTFEPSEDFHPESHLQQAFGVFKSSDNALPQTVRIRFDPKYARIVREKRWHSSEHYQQFSDHTILTMQISGLEAVKKWVLQFGYHAEVLEPPELRDMVQQSLEKTLEQYTK